MAVDQLRQLFDSRDSPVRDLELDPGREGRDPNNAGIVAIFGGMQAVIEQWRDRAKEMCGVCADVPGERPRERSEIESLYGSRVEWMFGRPVEQNPLELLSGLVRQRVTTFCQRVPERREHVVPAIPRNELVG